MASYDRIPFELKYVSQWINWKYETVTDAKGQSKVTKVPVRVWDTRLASVSNPLDWSGFDEAVSSATARGYGLGFVFTKSDPYCGIDLDNPEGDIEILSRQNEVLASLDSYAERSPSGNGLHIIIKAALPGMGKRRHKIECYDCLRFFTFTGDVFLDLPIMPRQSEVLDIYKELGKEAVEISFTGYEAEQFTDEQIYQKAVAAHNNPKFSRLWSGDWKTDYGDKSQSEADFALINIIGFYSRNLPQTVRIFRLSGLATRPKAKRGGYVGAMAKRAFDRFTPQVSLDMPTGAIWFDASKIEPWNVKFDVEAAYGPYETQAYTAGPIEYEQAPFVFSPSIPAYVQAPQPLRVNGVHHDPGRPVDFDPPIPPMEIPGLVGKLVKQAWESAPHQVAEVAIASALSAMSVLSARAYRHGSLGLSLYLLVLAKTSTGKSFGYKANDAWQTAALNHYRKIPPPNHIRVKPRIEAMEEMIIGEIGSAPGLADHMPRSPTTLFHADEYVDTIKEMARPNCNQNLAQIRSELLRLMEMSGPGRVYRGRKYSKRNTTATDSVNVFMASLTILATGTPEAFYSDMTDALLTSGFLPRFTIMEYEGGLTQRNNNVRRNLDPEMMTEILSLYDKTHEIGIHLTGDDGFVIDVQAKDEPAAAALEWFDNVCYREIEAANKDGSPTAGLWSRAKEHVRQIASLIAIGVNRHVPKIEAEHVHMAIKIVRPTLDKIAAKVTKGETGIGDHRLEAEVKKAILRQLEGKWLPGTKPELIEQGFVQLYPIKSFCTKLAVFKTHRIGANSAFEAIITSMSKYGTIKLVDVNGIKCCQAGLEQF